MLHSRLKYSTELLFEHNPKKILTRLLIFSFLSIWIFGFLFQGITTIDNSISNFLLSRIYSSVCHQESAKCISIGSASMLVCARCAGIYLGAFIAGLSSLLIITSLINRRVLILSALPLVIDVLFTFIGVYTYSKSVAFVTGFTFGGVAYLMFISELENLFSNKMYKGNE